MISPTDGSRGQSPRSKRTSPEPELLEVRVQPRARRNEVVRQPDGSFRVRVTAAPEGGAANRAVIALLAEALGVAPSRIALVRGAAARDKMFRVDGHPLAPTLSAKGRGGSNTLSPSGRGQGEGRR